MRGEDYTSVPVDFGSEALSETEVKANPLEQLADWIEEAIALPEATPTAMCLSTSTFQGRVSSRIVLLKRLDEKGLYFFTNYESKKGVQLLQNPYASAVFYWPTLERQARVEGQAQRLSDELNDRYFAQRDPQSQLGAWASPQSQTIPSRKYLDKLQADFQEEYNEQEIPRPTNWGGYCLVPEVLEFWQGRPNRLHDRLQYTLFNNAWSIERLAP